MTVSVLACFFLFIYFTEANFFNQFFQQHQQHHHQEQVASYEEQVLNSKCAKYLCPETQACVESPIQCPCPFPSSQLKCILPDNKNYICISKPTLSNPSYDDISKQSKVNGGGDIRDCGWVERAYKGLL